MSRRSRKIRVNNEYTTNEDIPNKDILVELLNNNQDGTIPFMNFLENTKTMFDNYEKLTKTMEVIQQQLQMIRRSMAKQQDKNLEKLPFLLERKTNDLSKSFDQLQRQIKHLANGDMLDNESSIKNMKPITTYFPLKKDLVEKKESISESNEKQELKVEDFDIDKELMFNLEEMQQLSLQVKELVGMKKK